MDNPYYIYHMNLFERTKRLNDSLRNEDKTFRQKYHSFIRTPEMDKEYNDLMNEKKLKKKSAIINLTSQILKEEYTYKYNYFKSGFKFMFLISFMLIVNAFIEFKYLSPSELNVSLLITSFISTGLIIALVINLNEKALLDTVGYSAFYLSSMIEVSLFFFLLLIKIYDLYYIINEISQAYTEGNQILSYSSFIFLILFNFVNIFGILFCSKFILDLFLEGFNILIMKEKTLFQKQLEINNKNQEKDTYRKIEFADEESTEVNGANSIDIIKIE